MKIKHFPKIIFALCALFCGYSVRADLTAVVTPGYTFPLDGSVPPTFANLNLLGQPTIVISGTLGGSNSIAPGSITLVQLNSAILDGTTLDFNGAGGTIEIAVQGVKTNRLNTNDWKWPLDQPTLASPLQFNYDPILFRASSATNDPTGLQFNYDPLFFRTNSATVNWTNPFTGALRTNETGLSLHFTTNTLPMTLTNGVTTNVFVQPAFNVVNQSNVVGGVTNVGPTLVLGGFVSTNATFIDGQGGTVLSIAHGLATTPTTVRCVLVCVTANNNWSVGDEADVFSARDANNSGVHWGLGANSTNVFLMEITGNHCQLPDKSSGTAFTVNNNASSWKLKFYAR